MGHRREKKYDIIHRKDFLIFVVLVFFKDLKQRSVHYNNTKNLTKRYMDRILKQNNTSEIFFLHRVLGLSSIEVYACVFGVAHFHHAGFSLGFTWLGQIQVYIIQLFRRSFFNFLRRPKQKCQT